LSGSLRRDQREADACIAGRRLDQRVAGRDVATLFGLFDHRNTDAVLDRAAGIREFELEQQTARSGVEFRDFEHRCAANHVEDV
jgi:hypothetical protein